MNGMIVLVFISLLAALIGMIQFWYREDASAANLEEENERWVNEAMG